MLDRVMGFEGMEGPLRSITEEHALGRRGRPEEIAAVAAFLVSQGVVKLFGFPD